jgi:hypothetical protein
MRSDSLKVNGHAYLAACDRALDQTVRLVYARGIAAAVDIDPGRAPSTSTTDPHEIRITYGGNTRAVTVDHDTFMDDEFFRTLVLHQLEAVVEELAASA